MRKEAEEEMGGKGRGGSSSFALGRKKKSQRPCRLVRSSVLQCSALSSVFNGVQDRRTTLLHL